MKIAVLIVGEYRTFPYCHKTMAFLYQPPSTGIDVDVFFSTWSVTRTTNPLVNCRGPKPKTDYKTVTEEEIRGLLNRPAVVKIHPPIDEADGFLIMRKGWLLGFELIEQSGIDYDYVYVMRPDLFFKKPFTLFTGVGYERYQDGLGLLPLNPTATPQICADCDFFSTYENIKKLFSPNILELDQMQGGLHRVWYEYVISKGLLPTLLPFAYPEPHLIARYPMSENSTWKEIEKNYWNIFHNRVV